MKSRWTFFPAIEQFANYTKWWDFLNERLTGNHPLISSNFVFPLIKHFGGNDLLLAILFENTTPVSMALIEKVRPFQWRTFLPAQSQISPILISDYEHIKSLIDDLDGHCLSFDILCNDSKYSPIDFYTGKSNLIQSKHAHTNSISVNSTFSDYWSCRPKKLRQNIKRYFNRLKKEGISYSFEIHSARKPLINALERYGNLESSGWKSTLGTAIHPDNKQGLFYLDVLNYFSENSSAKIIELYLNKKLSASRIFINNDNFYIALKTTFDETLKRYAPGRLLLYLAIEDLISNRSINTIEFYTNSTKEQLEWSTDSRWIEHISVYRNSLFKTLFDTHKIIKHLVSEEK